MVFSHQTICPEYFASSCNIPWNPPTNFRPIPIATISQMCLLNSAYCSLSNPFFLNGETLTCNDATIGLHQLCQIPRIVSVNEFWFPDQLQELLQAPFGFLWSFRFARIKLHPLNRQVLYHNCILVIVSRFTSFTENVVLCCYQVTKFFCAKDDSTNTSFSKSPYNFGPLRDLEISVSGNEYK